MISSVLLDTNVWLDLYIPMREGHAAAQSILARSYERRLDVLYAIHSMKDVAYIVERVTKGEIRKMGFPAGEAAHGIAAAMAEDALANMQAVATAVGSDSSDLWFANHYYQIHADFEDCLVLAAAKRSEADYLITNDRTLLRDSPLPSLAPEAFLALTRARA